MIKTKIENNIKIEFQNLRNELKTHLDNSSDVEYTKIFLSEHVPNEVNFKSRLLLDTILIYLAEQSKKELDSFDIEIKNQFLRVNLKEIVRSHFLQNGTTTLNKNNEVIFSSDPRISKSLAAGSIPIIIGVTLIGIAFPKFSIGSVATGIASIAISGVVYKTTYDKNEKLAHNIIISDIEKYLVASEALVREWIDKVIKVYEIEFKKFCQQENIKL